MKRRMVFLRYDAAVSCRRQGSRYSEHRLLTVCQELYLRSTGMEDAQIEVFLEILSQPDQEPA